MPFVPLCEMNVFMPSSNKCCFMYSRRIIMFIYAYVAVLVTAPLYPSLLPASQLQECDLVYVVSVRKQILKNSQYRTVLCCISILNLYMVLMRTFPSTRILFVFVLHCHRCHVAQISFWHFSINHFRAISNFICSYTIANFSSNL